LLKAYLNVDRVDDAHRLLRERRPDTTVPVGGWPAVH
jgi:hypothetical protein